MQVESKLPGLLRKIDFLASVDSDSLKQIESNLQLISFKPGEVLCREGDEGDHLFIIDSGNVSVWKRGEQAIEVEVARRGAGEVLGEMSLLGHMKRSATLKAVTAVQAWTLSHQVFQDLLEQRPDVARAVLERMARHLSRETSLVARLMSKDMDPRFKVAFFDAKPYMKNAFEDANEYDIVFHYFDTRLTPSTVSLAAGHDAVCIFVNDDVNADVAAELAGMDVKLIALRCAGYNNVDLEACHREGVTVTRVPDYSPYAVAEHAVTLMMTLNRKTHRANSRVREGNFSLSGLVGFDMHRRIAGVVGTGKIGQCLLSILKGFGCRLLLFDCMRRPEIAEAYGASFVELNELLEQSDIISLHVPLTPETRHMVNRESIARMKKGVMLINTGRGGLIDTEALIDGLKSGHIGSAGLDVYEEEQGLFFEDFSEDVLCDDVLARLTTFNNVLVTSHQGFLTSDALCNIANTTLKSITAFSQGKQGDDVPYAL